MTSAAQEHLTVMPTPGLLTVSEKFPTNVKNDEGTVVAQCWADGRFTGEQYAALIVKAVNAYSSTDALRSALAPYAKAAERYDEPPGTVIHDNVELWQIPPRIDFLTVGDLRKARAALSGSPAPSIPPMETEMTEAQIKHMVDRFLSWKLPTAFNPDGGISFERIAGASGPHPFVREPVGTNLLSADQATEMVRHMLEGLPSGSPAPSTECGWIVANGRSGNGEAWRYWTDLGPSWTSDREKATRYARREDAEAVHAGDEDVWTIEPYARTALAGVTASSAATRDVLAERARQQSAEGWTPEHDDTHTGFEMAQAAAFYALYTAADVLPHPTSDAPSYRYLRMQTADAAWPKEWDHVTWKKPKDARHNLVRAAALLIAEIERLDRAAPSAGITAPSEGE